MTHLRAATALNDWLDMLNDLRKVIGSDGKAPLPMALQALRCNSRSTLFRRIAGMNKAGFWITLDKDQLAVHDWPQWLSLGGVMTTKGPQ